MKQNHRSLTCNESETQINVWTGVWGTNIRHCSTETALLKRFGWMGSEVRELRHHRANAEAVCLILHRFACFWEEDAFLFIACHEAQRHRAVWALTSWTLTQGQCSNNKNSFLFELFSCYRVFGVKRVWKDLFNKSKHYFLTILPITTCFQNSSFHQIIHK